MGSDNEWQDMDIGVLNTVPKSFKLSFWKVNGLFFRFIGGSPGQETSVRDGITAAKQLVKDGFGCSLSNALSAFSESHEERSFQKNLLLNSGFQQVGISKG